MHILKLFNMSISHNRWVESCFLRRKKCFCLDTTTDKTLLRVVLINDFYPSKVLPVLDVSFGRRTTKSLDCCFSCCDFEHCWRWFVMEQLSTTTVFLWNWSDWCIREYFFRRERENSKTGSFKNVLIFCFQKMLTGVFGVDKHFNNYIIFVRFFHSWGGKHPKNLWNSVLWDT